MSRFLVGMSGDKDAMIRHLEKCEKRMLEQFAEIRRIAKQWTKSSLPGSNKSASSIVALCDVYLDKRSNEQKMQDQIDEMQKTIEELMEYKKDFLQRKEKEKQLRSDIGESLT